MIDPTRITRYGQSRAELEEFILFWVCAAGKNAKTTSRCLDNFLKTWRPEAEKSYKNPTPFEIVRSVSNLAHELKSHGIGCYNQKARTFLVLTNSGLDLETCTIEDLEKIPGFGPKTARCFIIHSRENQRYAGIDTHLLKFLKDMGYDVPKSTPVGKNYRRLEGIFLYLCDVVGMKIPELDLKVWNAYSGNGGTPEDVLGIFNMPVRKIV